MPSQELVSFIFVNETLQRPKGMGVFKDPSFFNLIINIFSLNRDC